MQTSRVKPLAAWAVRSVLAASPLVSLVNAAHAAILYDSTGGAPTVLWLVGKSSTSSTINQPANGFILSGGSFFLDEVTVKLVRSAGGGDFAIRFWRDAGGKPGALLESWTVPGNIPFNTDVTVSSVNMPTLTSGTGYWVSAAMPDDVSEGWWEAVNIPPQGRAIAFSNSASATWSFSLGHTDALAMKVTGTPVPEPSTWALLCMGGLILGSVAIRKWRRGAPGLLASWAIVAATTSMLAAPAKAAPARLGIMGDSLSAGNGSSWGENPNWHTQLTMAGKASVVVNPAFGGAETASLPSQRASIIPQVQAGQIDYSILIIGGNDIVFHYGIDIATGGDPNPFFDAVTNNIQSTFDAVAAAGSVRQIVANIPDASRSPAVQQTAQQLGLTQDQLNVAVAAIEEANARIQSLAFARGIPVLDLFRASQEIVDQPPLELAGVAFANLFAPDQFHPAPIIHGIMANIVIEAANRGYHADLAPFTDQELVQNVGSIPLVPGPTFFDVSPYVLVVPEPSALVLALAGCLGFAVWGRRLSR